ncbi:MAG: hypothetical protein EZS28_012765, partial [Streblomastix strix]
MHSTEESSPLNSPEKQTNENIIAQDSNVLNEPPAAFARANAEEFIATETRGLELKVNQFNEQFFISLQQTFQGLLRYIHDRDQEIDRLKRLHESTRNNGRLDSQRERAVALIARLTEAKYNNRFLGMCFVSWRLGTKLLRQKQMRKRKASTFHSMFWIKICFNHWRTFSLFAAKTNTNAKWERAAAEMKVDLADRYEEAIDQLQSQLAQANEMLRKEREARSSFHSDLRTAVFRGVTALNNETLRALGNRADLGLEIPFTTGLPDIDYQGLINNINNNNNNNNNNGSNGQGGPQLQLQSGLGSGIKQQSINWSIRIRRIKMDQLIIKDRIVLGMEVVQDLEVRIKKEGKIVLHQKPSKVKIQLEKNKQATQQKPNFPPISSLEAFNGQKASSQNIVAIGNSKTGEVSVLNNERAILEGKNVQRVIPGASVHSVVTAANYTAQGLPSGSSQIQTVLDVTRQKLDEPNAQRTWNNSNNAHSISKTNTQEQLPDIIAPELQLQQIFANDVLTDV